MKMILLGRYPQYRISMPVGEVISEGELKGSRDWQRSIGKHFNYRHYRKKNSGAHAECMDGVCKIHHDKVNPHEGLGSAILHLKKDAPRVGRGLCALIGTAAIAGCGFYGRKRL